jgi:hypothetical protein
MQITGRRIPPAVSLGNRDPHWLQPDRTLAVWGVPLRVQQGQERHPPSLVRVDIGFRPAGSREGLLTCSGLAEAGVLRCVYSWPAGPASLGGCTTCEAVNQARGWQPAVRTLLTPGLAAVVRPDCTSGLWSPTS